MFGVERDASVARRCWKEGSLPLWVMFCRARIRNAFGESQLILRCGFRSPDNRITVTDAVTRRTTADPAVSRPMQSETTTVVRSHAALQRDFHLQLVEIELFV